MASKRGVPVTNISMHYTYVLLSKKDNKLYTGYTNNLKQRIRKHSSGQVISTKARLPIQLIYYEVCGNKKDARAREKYLKSEMGKRYLKNRLRNYFENL